MSTDLTPELLQDISVRVVSNFMTKQAGLSEGIAKEAKEMELNPDQIKRVIESSNTIAYLRQLEDATDRSFEFPVAEYNHVMGHLVLPTMNNVVCKATNISTVGQAPYANATQTSEDRDIMGKKIIGDIAASTVDRTVEPLAPKLYEKLEVINPEQEQQKVAMLIKETLRVKQTMNKLAEIEELIWDTGAF